jgi:hypothetical protein
VPVPWLDPAGLVAFAIMKIQIESTSQATDEEIDAEFERFWKIFDPDQKQGSGVKEVARKCYHIGVRWKPTDP